MGLQNQIKKKSKYQGKNRNKDYGKGNKTIPEKVAQTPTEDEQKQTTKQEFNVDRKNEGTRDDRGRVGGPNFILCIKEQDNTANTSGT